VLNIICFNTEQETRVGSAKPGSQIFSVRADIFTKLIKKSLFDFLKKLLYNYYMIKIKNNKGVKYGRSYG